MMDAILWLPSLSIGIGALAGVVGWAGLIRLADPGMFSRIGRALKAHAPKSIAERRLRKLDLDMIAQLSVEVDMAWWDEQFKKLTRATYRRDPELVAHVDMGGNAASFAKWFENTTAEISSVTRGDMTFSMKQLNFEAETAALARDSARLLESTQSHRKEMDRQRAFKETMRSLNYEPGIPEPQKISLAKSVADAGYDLTQINDAFDAVKVTMAKAKAERLAKEAADRDCENCGYIEERTYATGMWIKRKTDVCDECREASFKAHKELGYVAAIALMHQNRFLSAREAAKRIEAYSA